MCPFLAHNTLDPLFTLFVFGKFSVAKQTSRIFITWIASSSDLTAPLQGPTVNNPTVEELALDVARSLEGWTRPKMESALLLALLLLAVIGGALSNPEAKRLYEDLLSNYNRLIRPVGNNSDRLTVKMGLRLAQLIDVSNLQDWKATSRPKSMRGAITDIVLVSVNPLSDGSGIDKPVILDDKDALCCHCV
uniref:Neurotransmitter-gated ion-channel ligand-binding domain-containing protein n=1 Tax=Timema bartmani TaxID=61472 RepID=A0A7R9F0H6_9NEOP|nr:unnamed protein product [Timema bartmani]